MTSKYFQTKTILPICKFEYPLDTKSVFLDTLKDHFYDLTGIPNCDEYIRFGCEFNQILEKHILSDGLQSIRFSNNFNQPIKKNGLHTIYFGKDFNQQIEKNVLPTELQPIQFSFDNNF